MNDVIFSPNEFYLQSCFLIKKRDTHTHTHTHTYTHTHIDTTAPTHTRIHINTHTHTQTHMHTKPTSLRNKYLWTQYYYRVGRSALWQLTNTFENGAYLVIDWLRPHKREYLKSVKRLFTAFARIFRRTLTTARTLQQT